MTSLQALQVPLVTGPVATTPTTGTTKNISGLQTLSYRNLPVINVL